MEEEDYGLAGAGAEHTVEQARQASYCIAMLRRDSV
jgi:hypothetical protein